MADADEEAPGSGSVGGGDVTSTGGDDVVVVEGVASAVVGGSAGAVLTTVLVRWLRDTVDGAS